MEIAPTEKAQVVIAQNGTPQPIVLRFNALKKALKEFDDLSEAWVKSKAKKGPDICGARCDVFICNIDLTTITSIALVDLAQHAKFVPWQAPA